MPPVIIENIKLLVNTRKKNNPDGYRGLRGKELAHLPCVENAYLIIKDGIIAEYGPMSALKNKDADSIDASGQYILPCWCDSHTHLVFAAYREEEFVDKIKGLSYAEIAAKGGGILNSAKKLNAMAESELLRMAMSRLNEVMRSGTGAIEIKSGYGLSVERELKMLRVIKKLKELSPIPIKATFLGAHTYPLEYKEN